jgi:hypothetical protein
VTSHRRKRGGLCGRHRNRAVPPKGTSLFADVGASGVRVQTGQTARKPFSLVGQPLLAVLSAAKRQHTQNAAVDRGENKAPKAIRRVNSPAHDPSAGLNSLQCNK